MKCLQCGSERVYRDGFRYTQAGRVQAFQCRTCGKKSQTASKFKPERVGYLDIETSQLKADFGFMYSWAIKQKSGPVTYSVLRHRTLHEEKRLLEKLLREMHRYDRLVTYNGTRFDIPFIRVRAFYHQLPFPGYGEIVHTDLYFVAKHKLLMSSRRLDRVAAFLGIHGKTPLQPETWFQASFGNRRAWSYILQHNIADVKVLEEVDKRLEQHYKMANRSI